MLRFLSVSLMVTWIVFVPVCEAADRFVVLSYHDVVDDRFKTDLPNVIATETADLVEHFSWLKYHGYHVVSLGDVIAARDQGVPLPDKAVVLTFDDGYRSMYTKVFPLLKLFNYPAVAALVGSWMTVEPGKKVAYGENQVERKNFLTWSQVNEMQASGLVEVASHSFDLHRYVVANPQGNTQPAAITRIYDRENSQYENDEQYGERIRADLEKNINVIYKNTGVRPRALVWPYGSYNQLALTIATDLGSEVGMGLTEGDNQIASLGNLNRIFLLHDTNLPEQLARVGDPVRKDPVRLAHVDLDYIYDDDPQRQKKNLDILLDRIVALKINTVYLQAFADPDGDGNAEALYFPNRHMTMRADLFNRVAWQLRTRASVEVYAWMPVLAFELQHSNPLFEEVIKIEGEPNAKLNSGHQHRLSPFSPGVKELVGEIYEDLAKHSYFKGLLFHDDAYLSDYEDASKIALSYYKKEWGLPASVSEIRKQPELLARWTKLKTQYMVDFTHYLANKVKRYRPGVVTARNIYARVVLNPLSETWFAQSLPAFIDNYDYTAVMAMPFMEGAGHPEKWLEALVNRIDEIPGALNKTVFELQSVDWKLVKPIGSDRLAEHMRILLANGAPNFGYYPDDFIKSYPDVALIKPVLSINSFPYDR
ncbi:MAG: poly-beta-1,6-N-acetyl-D-glucosamine N-deacetylase PgaB [Gammaproteobacteria bacterium]